MEGFYWDHFAPSVPMSTYLVAFIVANFTQVEADVGNATWKFNIYARPSARNQAQWVPSYLCSLIKFQTPEFYIISFACITQRYASEIGPKIQAFFEDYFQIPFPLPKQDMIAIPDFAAGPFSFHSICFHSLGLTEIRLHFSEFRCHGKLGIDYLQVKKKKKFIWPFDNIIF